MNKLQILERDGSGVFTAQDLMVLWGYSDEQKLYELIKYHVRQRNIYVVARGMYSLVQLTEQDIRADTELLYLIANKAVPNSYVSLFTILKQEGLIDQYNDAVYSVAGRGVERQIMGVKFVYRKIKDNALLNDLGIVIEARSRRASRERAVVDTIYLYPHYNLERVEMLEIPHLRAIAKIYGNNFVVNRLQKLGGEHA